MFFVCFSPGSHREWTIWTQTAAVGAHVLPKKPTAWQAKQTCSPSVLEAGNKRWASDKR